jgi:hypothetical protein
MDAVSASRWSMNRSRPSRIRVTRLSPGAPLVCEQHGSNLCVDSEAGERQPTSLLSPRRRMSFGCRRRSTASPVFRWNCGGDRRLRTSPNPGTAAVADSRSVPVSFAFGGAEWRTTADRG